MNKPAKPREEGRSSNRLSRKTAAPAEYDAWQAGEIEAGCAELDAGEGIPAEQVWKDLGLE